MGESKLPLKARRQEALALCLAGKTTREIAQILQVSQSTAWRDVRGALRSQARASEKQVEAYRELLGERYEALIAAWWTKALSDAESKAGERVMKAIEGLRDLQGLDRPVSRDDDRGDGGPLTVVVNTKYVPGGGE